MDAVVVHVQRLAGDGRGGAVNVRMIHCDADVGQRGHLEQEGAAGSDVLQLLDWWSSQQCRAVDQVHRYLLGSQPVRCHFQRFGCFKLHGRDGRPIASAVHRSDLKNNVLKNYTLDQCTAVTTDTVAGRFAGQANTLLPNDMDIPGKHILLCFEVTNAKLCLPWIE